MFEQVNTEQRRLTQQLLMLKQFVTKSSKKEPTIDLHQGLNVSFFKCIITYRRTLYLFSFFSRKHKCKMWQRDSKEQEIFDSVLPQNIQILVVAIFQGAACFRWQGTKEKKLYPKPYESVPRFSNFVTHKNIRPLKFARISAPVSKKKPNFNQF